MRALRGLLVKVFLQGEEEGGTMGSRLVDSSAQDARIVMGAVPRG